MIGGQIVPVLPHGASYGILVFSKTLKLALQ